ncbi:hypothetical protein [Streptomyces sp. NBC_01104]|uniref:hypothetical protein n=1 Tax=Streptomyces sp. NBC_01104 TaxID=2903750 RepID=UPI003869C5D6
MYRLGADLVGLGDAAVDLIAARCVLPAGARDTFRAAAEADDAAWVRGIGWALSIALMELQYYRETNAFMADTARHVIAEILADSGSARSRIRALPGAPARLVTARNAIVDQRVRTIDST